MKSIVLLLITMIISDSILLPEISYGQLKTYQFEQLDSMQKKKQRPMAVFIHSDWCNYCKSMQNTSFKNKKVEENRSIRFHGHTFHHRPGGNNIGVHEFAEQLGTIGGKISFLSLIFLNAKNEIIYQHEGFIDSHVLEKNHGIFEIDSNAALS